MEFQYIVIGISIPLLALLVTLFIHWSNQRNIKKQFVTQKLEEMYLTIEDITMWKKNLLMLYGQALFNIMMDPNAKVDLDIEKINLPTQIMEKNVNYCPKLRPYYTNVVSACETLKKGLYDFFYVALGNRQNPSIQFNPEYLDDYMKKPIDELDNSLDELKVQLDKRLQKY